MTACGGGRAARAAWGGASARVRRPRDRGRWRLVRAGWCCRSRTAITEEGAAGHLRRSARSCLVERRQPPGRVARACHANVCLSGTSSTRRVRRTARASQRCSSGTRGAAPPPHTAQSSPTCSSGTRGAAPPPRTARTSDDDAIERHPSRRPIRRCRSSTTCAIGRRGPFAPTAPVARSHGQPHRIVRAPPRPTRIPSSPPFTSVPDLRDRATVPNDRPARSAPHAHRALENSCVRCPLWQRRECASPMTFHLPAGRSSFMP